MKCYFCENEMEYVVENDFTDFYRHIEGRGTQANIFYRCNVCGSIYENSKWIPPSINKEKYVATKKQVNTIIGLMCKYKMTSRIVDFDVLKLLYSTTWDNYCDKNTIIISKKDANFIIKQLIKLGSDWEEKLQKFVSQNVKHDYLKSHFVIGRELLLKLLINRVEII